METFSLKLKLMVTLNGTKLKLVNRLKERQLLWIDELGEPFKMMETQFYRLYESRALVVDEDQPYLGVIPTVRNAPPDITCFPEKHSAEALRRRSYLTRVIDCVSQTLPGNNELRELIQQVAKEIDDPRTPPSVSTVRRWFLLFRTGSVVKLVPHHTGKGRARVIVGELEDVVLDLLETDYLRLERPLLSTVYAELKARLEVINAGRLPTQRLALPSEMSFRRYVDSLDPYEVDKGRLGKHAANQLHRTAIGKLVVGKILDRWEIDHTPLDILVVDPETGKHIGRPFLTIVLDRHSRMVMSSLIHFAAPNTESVLRAIERAIRPKAGFLSRFPTVLSEWRAHGLPARIVPDNAAEFHAGDLVSAFNELGIEIMYPASRAPQKKGAVERFFRTLNEGLIHRLPGTTFSNTRERGDYPAEELACLTLVELEAKLVKWIVDVYHQRTHRSLPSQMSPAQAWLAGESQRHICLPTDLDALESVLARRKESPVHHYGVEVGTHVYHSPELAELKMKLAEGEKIQVRYRDELGHVWVHDRFRNVFILVPAKDKRLVGMSRETFDLARAQLRQSGKSSPTFEVIHQAYRDIMADVEDLKRSQKLRKRREAAKVKLDRGGAQQTPAQSDPKSAMDFLDAEIQESIPGYSVVSRAPRMRGKP
jgi:putative transposase